MTDDNIFLLGRRFPRVPLPLSRRQLLGASLSTLALPPGSRIAVLADPVSAPAPPVARFDFPPLSHYITLELHRAPGEEVGQIEDLFEADSLPELEDLMKMIFELEPDHLAVTDERFERARKDPRAYR